MNFNSKQKNFNKNTVNDNINKNVINEKANTQDLSYSYYSNVLKKPFRTLNELKDAEAAYYTELKAKEDKVAQKRADAKKVEDAFKCLNAARKVYKESITDLTTRYTKDLKELKATFEKDKAAIHSSLAEREEAYSRALKAFTDKYPEGYHLTLKDGDFETTISSQTTAASKHYTVNTFGDLLDMLFNF